MNKLWKLLIPVLCFHMAGLASAQPRCPTPDDIRIEPAQPPLAGSIVSMRRYQGTNSTSWGPPVQDSPGRISIDLGIVWQGSFGVPTFSTLIEPLPPGDYHLAISPFYRVPGQDEPVWCPQLVLPITIAGGGGTEATSVPAFSLPGLVLLLGLFGLIGWSALRPR